ncbi:MAG: carbonic anhydrase [Oscillospiraceae bacterium]|jgi:carbonic anhydrase|nr:carbonic anhydrase [Oscillospiraceae bacterium]
MEKLIEGNLDYLAADDVYAQVRHDTSVNGQRPYAVVVTCSDSRVPPEHIFSAGLGELFVVRTAGNVVGDYERGTVEYAVGHLGAKLVLVMGHSHCGAVGAALELRSGESHAHAPKSLGAIVSEIAEAIKHEDTEAGAVQANVRNSIARLRESEELREVRIVGAIYDIETGKVKILDT